MTNFEKWKKDLKPEDLIIDRGEDTDRDECRFVAGFLCEICPAKKAGSCRKDFWTDCGEAFKNWANEEAT